jgi:hypothetical protein
MLHRSMSKHWCPDENLAALHKRKPRRPKLPPGGAAALVLLALFCVAAGSGIYQVLGPRDVIAESATVR